jgi:hypothetical protein
MTKKEPLSDFDRYQHVQILKLLDLFQGANGRLPSTVEELNAWLLTPEGEGATAYDSTPDGKIIPDFGDER